MSNNLIAFSEKHFGRLRQGTVEPKGRVRYFIMAIIGGDFILFMFPKETFTALLPSIESMPDFVVRHMVSTSFPENVQLFWILFPLVFFLVFLPWVISVWRRESNDYENLKRLKTKGVVFIISILCLLCWDIFFNSSPGKDFMSRKFAAESYQLSWFFIYCAGCFFLLPASVCVLVLKLNQVFHCFLTRNES
jgi:hypothetical protein